MNATLSVLARRLDRIAELDAGVIPWSSPVPCFGSLPTATVATVGLNPSNREFVDLVGRELEGEARRFHTLNSLGLARWSEAKKEHLDRISLYCRQYFARNPYNLWFRRLDYVISGARVSYYSKSATACHLDLVPYATASKWNALNSSQRSALSEAAGDTLGRLIQHSSIKVLVLNGSSVARQFEELSKVNLHRKEKRSWKLSRDSSATVKGFSYEGRMSRFDGVNLRRNVLIVGFNHNIQSSFGVTAKVLSSIKAWVAEMAGTVQ